MTERSIRRATASDADVSDGSNDGEQDAAQAFNAMRETFSAETAKIAALLEGQIQHSKAMAKTVSDLAISPALKLTPQQYARELEAVRAEAVRGGHLVVATELEAHKSRLIERNDAEIDDRVAAQLATWRIAWWGAPFFLGLILYPLLSLSMPGGNTLATWATGHRNGWAAGSQLMRAADPVSWTKMVEAWDEIQRQQVAIQACRGTGSMFPAVASSSGPSCDVILPKPMKGK
jgi:Family of unknown function (DUF6118)